MQQTVRWHLHAGCHHITTHHHKGAEASPAEALQAEYSARMCALKPAMRAARESHRDSLVCRVASVQDRCSAPTLRTVPFLERFESDSQPFANRKEWRVPVGGRGFWAWPWPMLRCSFFVARKRLIGQHGPDEPAGSPLQPA